MGITWGSSKKAENHQGSSRGSSAEVRPEADYLDILYDACCYKYGHSLPMKEMNALKEHFLIP